MPKKGYIKKNAKPRTVRERAYDSTPERKKARAERNRKRNEALKKGRVKKGDGKVVNHKKKISKGLSKAKNGGTSIHTAKQSSAEGGRTSKGKRKKK